MREVADVGGVAMTKDRQEFCILKATFTYSIRPLREVKECVCVCVCVCARACVCLCAVRVCVCVQ